MPFPDPNYMSDESRTNAQMAQALEDWLAACRQLPGAAAAETFVLNTNTIVPTRSLVVIEPGVAQTLRRIQPSQVGPGHLLVLLPAEGTSFNLSPYAGGAGQLLLTADSLVTLRSGQSIMLARVGDEWLEVGRYEGARGYRAYSAGTQTFQVPPGVYRIKVELIGGGGGGGAAATEETDGTDGAAGGDTVFGAWAVAGGPGGYGGKTNGQGGAGRHPGGQNGQHGHPDWTAAPGRGGAGVYNRGVGGRGGWAQAAGVGAGGGAAQGEHRILWLSVTPGDTYEIQVGTGGAGGDAGQPTAGTNGSGGFVIVEW